MGATNRTAIGTLVAGTTRYVVLVHLPQGRNAAHFRDRLISVFSTVPTGLRRSLAIASQPLRRQSASEDLGVTLQFRLTVSGGNARCRREAGCGKH
jgi:hypothetical protein